MRRSLPVLGCALALAASAGAASVRAPQTLVTTRGPIRAFTQNGGRIAWVGPKWDVRVRTLDAGKTLLAGSARPWGRQAKNAIPVQVAISGRRVIWTASGGGDSLETDVHIWHPGQRVQRLVGGAQADRYVGVGDGGYFDQMAGAGGTLVFSTSFYRCADDNCTELAVPAGPEAQFNGTYRVVGATKRKAIPGAPAGFALAVAGRRVAILPAANPIPTESFPYAAPGTTVDIRDANTGNLVAQFTPPGTVQAIALSGAVAAVVDATSGGRVIERYNATTGDLLGSTAVEAADSLAVHGTTIIFAAGKTIETMDATSGAVSVLAQSPGLPIGLSVSGRRLAWAVNVGRRGRVLAVTLP